MLKTKPWVMVLGGEDFWGVIRSGHDGGALLNGLSDLI